MGKKTIPVRVDATRLAPAVAKVEATSKAFQAAVDELNELVATRKLVGPAGSPTLVYG